MSGYTSAVSSALHHDSEQHHQQLLMTHALNAVPRWGICSTDWCELALRGSAARPLYSQLMQFDVNKKNSQRLTGIGPLWRSLRGGCHYGYIRSHFVFRQLANWLRRRRMRVWWSHSRPPHFTDGVRLWQKWPHQSFLSQTVANAVLQQIIKSINQ